MNYDDAVRYLLTLGGELAAPRQPALGPAGAMVAKFDLRNITALARHLGEPQRACRCVHIAGTNGKGSTAAMLESILRHAGLRTGLYTSPHLERINERIAVNGELISDAAFAAAFTRVHHAIEELLASGPEASGLAAHPTFFECITAMAFDHFARAKVNFAVFEVGMGGRLDSTNIVHPEVSVITQIDFDHENYLGHSIEQIAGEKAGIIKPGVPVVCAAGHPEARAVIARRAADLCSPVLDIDESAGTKREWRVGTELPDAICLRPPLLGRFQLRNARTATAAAILLRNRGFAISDEAITVGVAQTRWPGRLELIAHHPDVYLDGTHNPAGARELLAFWDEHLAGRRIVLVFGAVRDKALEEITSLLFPRAAHVICTQPRSARAISAQRLTELTAHDAGRVEVIAEPEAALARALQLAAPNDVVFATGSLYLVGDLRRWWRARHSPLYNHGLMRALGNALGLLRNFLVTVPLVYLSTIVMGTLSLFLSLFDASGRLQHGCARQWARMLLAFGRVRVTVRGAEHIPAGPCIFAANHLSYMDIPAAFGYIPTQFRIMAKASLFHLPFLGWHLRRSGHMPIARNNPRRAARSVLEAAGHVKEGMSVFVFPEGGRSLDGQLGEFKPGTFLLAIKAGAPVVPVTINGTRTVLPYDSWRANPGHVELVFHPPIPTAGMHSDSARALAQQVRATIAADFKS